jgi:hypothetical protein
VEEHSRRFRGENRRAGVGVDGGGGAQGQQFSPRF